VYRRERGDKKAKLRPCGKPAGRTCLSRTRHWAAEMSAPHKPSLGRYCAGEVCLSHASSATLEQAYKQLGGNVTNLMGGGGRPHLSLEDKTLGCRNERPAQVQPRQVMCWGSLPQPRLLSNVGASVETYGWECHKPYGGRRQAAPVSRGQDTGPPILLRPTRPAWVVRVPGTSV
jgi:hypothetical protein